MLAGTLARVRALSDNLFLQLGHPPGDAWLRADEVEQRLEELLGRVQARYGADRAVAAAFFTGSYAWGIVGGALACLVTERRAPDVSMANLSLRFDEQGYVTAVALVTSRFACLATDPAAAACDVLTAPDADRLRRWLRARIVEHLERLVQPLRNTARRGRSASWKTITDACTGVFTLLARAGLDHDFCRAEANAFLATGPPLVANPILFSLECNGKQHLFMRRKSCCLAYRLAEFGYCATCPLVSDAEREQRIRRSLMEESP